MALHGTSKAYIVDRLRRENQTALLAAVEVGTITAMAAAVELGWVKRPPGMGGSTHKAKRIQHQLQAITGEGLSAGEAMELQYGPNPSAGSLFSSREHLERAWQRARERLLTISNPGRRPLAFYEFEFDGHRPPYDTERSVLWRKGLLSADEKVALEAEWKAEFERAQAPDFTLNDGSDEMLVGDCARAAYYRWEDIPRELVKRWTAARRRRGRQQRASLEEAAAIK